jgi:hypothetical protein
MSGKSPYRTVLRSRWSELAPEVRAFHRGGRVRATGRADVSRGAGLLARLACAVFRLPPAGRDIPLQIALEPAGSGEIWTRRYGASVMRSRQWAGPGGAAPLLYEALGPVVFVSALEVVDGGLRLAPRRWFCLGLPLPLALGPKVEATEGARDGRYVFDVALSHASTGLIVHYRGWLQVDDEEGSPNAA